MILERYRDSKLQLGKQLGCLKCMEERPGYQQQVGWKFGRLVLILLLYSQQELIDRSKHSTHEILHNIVNTYSMKQPDLHYFETIKMTSQASSNFVWRI